MGRKIAQTFHPSFSIVEALHERGWSQVEFARKLGISLQYTSDIIHARRGISARVAVALEAVGLGSAEYWMQMQAAYDVDLYRSILEEKSKQSRSKRGK